MKASHAEFARHTTEPAVPLPTTAPLTEEIIISSVNFAEEHDAPQVEQFRKDEAYPLAHKMLNDLVVLQGRIHEKKSYEDFTKAIIFEKRIITHVYNQIRSGFLAETPLALDAEPEKDEFTLHVAKTYVKSEVTRIREFGPDPEVMVPQKTAQFEVQSLFDTVDEVEAISADPAVTGRAAELPRHIEVVPVESLSEQAKVELGKFTELVKRAGHSALELIGVSYHSGEIKTVGPNDTKVMDVVSEGQLARR